ncbi:MAG: aminotransferase class V-fold PLP-dependent enzyme [Actinomycetota bacterium]|nr:aminotransferase class V-fold PLP-dependent enzyme [Actinomycetota bacterium]
MSTRKLRHTVVVISRDDALALDAADPIAHFRDRFHIPDPAVVYLDGNSLGMPPKRTLERLTEVYQHDWATGLIRSWEHWVDLPQRVGDQLAPLIGASPGEVVLHDNTTLCVYQAVHAALGLNDANANANATGTGNGSRPVIAISADDFPTDRYVVDGIAAATGRTVRHGFDRLDDVAVVVRSVIDYRTAELVDVAAETARAHAAGAVVVWDLSHAVGAIDIDLRACGVQLAVGCSYKYLNGGPGAPAWSYVASELHAVVRQPIWGWFATERQFEMGATFEPRPDIARMLLGTPSILALTAAEVGIALSAEAGMPAIHAKGTALTTLAIDLCDQYGLATPTPRDPARRGNHVAVQHPNAKAIVRELAARDVIFDFREPNIVRAGCSPLTTRFVDVFDGLSAVARLAAG